MSLIYGPVLLFVAVAALFALSLVSQSLYRLWRRVVVESHRRCPHCAADIEPVLAAGGETCPQCDRRIWLCIDCRHPLANGHTTRCALCDARQWTCPRCDRNIEQAFRDRQPNCPECGEALVYCHACRHPLPEPNVDRCPSCGLARAMCGGCGYDLRGTFAAGRTRCPECGLDARPPLRQRRPVEGRAG